MHRGAEGQRAARISIDVSVELRRGCWCSAASRPTVAGGRAAGARGARVGRRRSSASARSSSSRAATRASSTTIAGCRTAPTGTSSTADRAGFVTGARRRAGRPRLGGARRRPRSRRRSGRSGGRHHGRSPSPATRCAPATPVLELHYRDAAARQALALATRRRWRRDASAAPSSARSDDAADRARAAPPVEPRSDRGGRRSGVVPRWLAQPAAPSRWSARS